jgi:hypothetical protein
MAELVNLFFEEIMNKNSSPQRYTKKATMQYGRRFFLMIILIKLIMYKSKTLIMS